MPWWGSPPPQKKPRFCPASYLQICRNFPPRVLGTYYVVVLTQPSQVSKHINSKTMLHFPWTLPQDRSCFLGTQKLSSNWEHRTQGEKAYTTAIFQPESALESRYLPQPINFPNGTLGVPWSCFRLWHKITAWREDLGQLRGTRSAWRGEVSRFNPWCFQLIWYQRPLPEVLETCWQTSVDNSNFS